MSAAIVGLLAIPFTVPARAQTLQDLEELRRRSQAEAEERQRRQQEPAVRLPRAVPPLDVESIELPGETPCFPVAQVLLTETAPDTFAWMPAWLARYDGRCLGRKGIELIIRRLSGRLIGDGYITTRVGLPEQELSAGILQLEVVPGRIGAVRFADPDPDTSWRSAFPARPGDLLNLRDIEQALEQLKRVPSQDATIDIAPGALPGESDVVITLKQTKPWRVGFTADDGGSRATGRNQGSASIALDNPLGLNDLLSASVNGDLWNDRDTRGTEGYGLNYSLPWGWWTASLNAGTSRYRQTVRGINQSFVSSGDSTSGDLRLQRVVHRGQTQKTSLYGRLQIRAQRSAIDGVDLVTQHRQTTAVELGAVHRHYLGRTQLDLTLAHREGVSWFGGQEDVPGATATWRYRVNTLDAALLVPFRIADRALRWNSALRAQQTSDTLYAVDYFGIGNRYTVRGFDGEHTLAAERGLYWRNDFEAPLGDGRNTLYLGLDAGRVEGPGTANLPGRSLSGAAVGLRGAHLRNDVTLSFDLFAAWALSKPAGLTTARPAAGFQLSLQY
ncbi:MAG: ShlB/FhaC/HecB family hemolysin secretion/activation protein [Rhodocyclales bacterium]|nr:ShlB/FhaC/HecB family hemolysin secretion/activation protein [Rhodocyclales bacterium]